MQELQTGFGFKIRQILMWTQCDCRVGNIDEERLLAAQRMRDHHGMNAILQLFCNVLITDAIAALFVVERVLAEDAFGGMNGLQRRELFFHRR